MSGTIWVFARGREVLRLIRRQAPPVLVVVHPDGGQQEYTGHTDSELGPIQTTIEAELRRDGWTLEHFAPERRERPERRGQPRGAADRRKQAARDS